MWTIRCTRTTRRSPGCRPHRMAEMRRFIPGRQGLENKTVIVDEFLGLARRPTWSSVSGYAYYAVTPGRPDAPERASELEDELHRARTCALDGGRYFEAHEGLGGGLAWRTGKSRKALQGSSRWPAALHKASLLAAPGLRPAAGSRVSRSWTGPDARAAAPAPSRLPAGDSGPARAWERGETEGPGPVPALVVHGKAAISWDDW